MPLDQGLLFTYLSCNGAEFWLRLRAGWDLARARGDGGSSKMTDKPMFSDVLSHLDAFMAGYHKNPRPADVLYWLKRIPEYLAMPGIVETDCEELRMRGAPGGVATEAVVSAWLIRLSRLIGA